MFKNRKTAMFLFIAVIAMVTVIVCMVTEHRKDVRVTADSMPSVTVSETIWWMEDGEYHETVQEKVFGNVARGCILYDAYGYTLLVNEVYEDGLKLMQDGGLMLANSDGTMSVLNEAEDFYETDRDGAIVLRSFSYSKGIILRISCNRY